VLANLRRQEKAFLGQGLRGMLIREGQDCISMLRALFENRGEEPAEKRTDYCEQRSHSELAPLTLISRLVA
jgi:hypothetical protein